MVAACGGQARAVVSPGLIPAQALYPPAPASPSGTTSSVQRGIWWQKATRKPGRDVKHQGASEPSGFRQKFSRRSLCSHFSQVGSHPAHQPTRSRLEPLAPPPGPTLLPQVHSPCSGLSPHLQAYFSGTKRCWCGFCASHRWQGTPAEVVLVVPR